MSAHLAIQAAIVGALTAAPALAGGNVKANSVRPLPATQGQALVVRMLSSRSTGQQGLGAPYDWVTTYQVECLARAATAAADPVAAVDTLLGQAWQRLSSLDPIALGAIDVRMQPGIDWQTDDADLPVAAAVISLQITHRTGATNLNAQA
jgi:hypothetical protein